ncbi:MAG: hypothetical protein GFH27_549307n76 [Chloroflexi bacterium AL-W]|nr:hypothetical protein [Chloroflexi bacterium AL-N1]NOK69108.1 hypothetical protein [Chloroflexi bacterium AL-N10]NOK77091.1 hypothetical protein [Chloroflexi bacterium AL-N5]NOK83736.1 hypothetical protein [Chloroflexi bacterium AL-W]NOK90946.1 hypothetical protein [Chloroflexi bacterium AL-N15]
MFRATNLIAGDGLLIQQIQCHTGKVTTSLPDMLASYQQFDEALDIRPVDCDRAAKVVRQIHEATTSVCTLLRQTDQLPTNISVNRYSLLSLLCHIQEQSHSLLQKLSYFRAICRDETTESRQQRLAIVNCFDDLIQAIDTLQPKCYDLLEQTSISPTTVTAA